MKQLFFVLLLFGFSIQWVSKCYAVDLTDYIIVTDIDDTLRHTLNRHEGQTLQFIQNIFRNRAFVGANKVLQQLNSKGAQIIYLSGAPKLIRFLPARFLRESGFPDGQLSLRDSLRENILDSKYDRALRLMQENPKKIFIFLGDNGEQDIEFFQRLQNNQELFGRIKMLLVHKMYKIGIGAQVHPGQVSYLTSADLAMRLFSEGLINKEDLNDVIQEVLDKLNHPVDRVRAEALPDLDQVEAADLNFSESFGRQSGLGSSLQVSLIQYNRDMHFLKDGPQQSFIPICLDVLL